MAPKISLASVLLSTLLALGASSLGPSDYGVQDINTLNDDYHLDDPGVELAAVSEDHDVDDDTEIEEGTYDEQLSDSGREKRRLVRRRTCGPDITSWLLRQMNQNRNNREIRRCRSWTNTFLWPRCLVNFARLVGNCRPWDYKCTQSFTRTSCPRGCPRTVTLCGRCVNYDVPGNIHYGYVGRAATIRRWLLLYAADRVQKGGVDDPKDQEAIKIGMDLWDVPSKRSRFCREVLNKINSLNLQGTSGCYRCTTRY